MNDAIRAQLTNGDVTALLTSMGPDEVREVTMPNPITGATVSMTALRFGGTVYGVVLDGDENIHMIVERHTSAECATDSMDRAYQAISEEYANAARIGLMPADGLRVSHTDVPAGTWSTV